MKVREMRRRFTVKEYHRMVEAGILHEDGNVELIQGEVIEKHPPGKKRFTVEEYHRMAEVGILHEDDRVEQRLGWDEDEFSRVRDELEDAGCIATMGAPQSPAAGAFWIQQAGRDQCPEPLGGRDPLQIRD